MPYHLDDSGSEVFALASSDIAITLDSQRLGLVELLDSMRYSAAPAEVFHGRLLALLCPEIHDQSEAEV